MVARKYVRGYNQTMDDFLKVRETLTRIGVASEKIKHYINLVIFYINKVNILLHTLKNYLL